MIVIKQTKKGTYKIKKSTHPAAIWHKASIKDLFDIMNKYSSDLYETQIESPDD